MVDVGVNVRVCGGLVVAGMAEVDPFRVVGEEGLGSGGLDGGEEGHGQGSGQRVGETIVVPAR
ncbi:MAG: hypothetical protein HYU66_12915 [Armatimonadetes bacterium]|nr:hypothetical protein [Armatimonadota bacterium]